MERYHMFEYASASFQVGIVVASASIVTGVALPLWAGVGLGALGMALAGLGFFAPSLIHF
jgi:multidrug transporter EmrE-like cation transporter